MKTPESYEKVEIDAFLKRIGPEHAWWFKPSMFGLGKRGVPDYVCCIDGCFWSLEVKRPGKQPTDVQHRRMMEIAKTRGRTIAGTADVIIQALTDWLNARGIVVHE